MSSSTSLPRLLTAQEVADELGLSRWRLYELCRKEGFPHVRLGRALRFDPGAVREWLGEGGTAGGGDGDGGDAERRAG